MGFEMLDSPSELELHMLTTKLRTQWPAVKHHTHDIKKLNIV